MSKYLGFCLIALWWTKAAIGQTIYPLPTGYPDAYFQTANIRWFASEVERTTAGRIRFDVQPGGKLAPLARIREGVEQGKYAIGEFNLSAEAAIDPLLGLDALPFIVESYADAELLWQLSRPAIEQMLAARGLVLLYAVPWPPQGLYSETAVDQMKALSGLRFRTYNASTERLAELMGAQPVAVPLVELPAALAAKQLDILLTSATSGVETQAWNHMHHYLDVRAWYPKNAVVANAALWAKLSAGERQAILTAAGKAEVRGWQASREQDARDRKMLAGHGMQVSRPTPRLSAELQRLGERLVREYLHTAGPDALGILLNYNNRRTPNGD